MREKFELGTSPLRGGRKFGPHPELVEGQTNCHCVNHCSAGE